MICKHIVSYYMLQVEARKMKQYYFFERTFENGDKKIYVTSCRLFKNSNVFPPSIVNHSSDPDEDESDD